MMKAGIDQDALVKLFAEASVKQGEALRKTVAETTLKALQSRELTLGNIRKVVKTVTQAASSGAAQNLSSPGDVETLLERALSGMDSALLKAVEANRKALAQFVEHGVGLQEKQLKEAVANIEKMEDVFFSAVAKATQGSGPMQAPWEHVLSAMRTKGTDTGTQATAVVEQLMTQTQTALREGRASGMRAAQAMMDSYAALVSGVLIGMSEGLQQKPQGGSAGTDDRAESASGSAQGKGKSRSA